MHVSSDNSNKLHTQRFCFPVFVIHYTRTSEKRRDSSSKVRLQTHQHVQIHLGSNPSVPVVCPKYIATIKMIYIYSCTHFHFYLLTLPFILSAIQCTTLLIPKKAMDMNVLLVTSLTSKCVVNYTCRKASSD